jgi:hypothetical protein
MIFAWQGWQIELPDDWSPVRLEGTFESGCALLSDIRRARLGLRWATPRHPFDAKKWASDAMVEEVGQLAAQEAESIGAGRCRDALLYTEADPPGRDVFVATSESSGRLIQMVHHVYADEPRLIELPPARFLDTRAEDEMAWSVSDLNFRTAIGWRLKERHINAGEMRLEFARGADRLSIQRLSIAHLAIKRRSIEQMLEDQVQPWLKGHRRIGANESLRLELADHTEVEGLCCRLERRRFRLGHRGSPVGSVHAVLHDAARDRILFIDAADMKAEHDLIKSMEWVSSNAVLEGAMR